MIVVADIVVLLGVLGTSSNLDITLPSSIRGRFGHISELTSLLALYVVVAMQHPRIVGHGRTPAHAYLLIEYTVACIQPRP